MADREIRLIGSFRDDITPKLNRLNRQLLGTIKQFEKLQNKIAPVAAEMAKFNTAAAATSGNLKSQRSAIEENIRMLRQYRTELSRTANAQSRMGRGGMPRPPRGGGGGGGGGPIPPRAGGGGTPRRGRGGGGGYGGGGDGFGPREIGAGVFGVTLGNQLASTITGSVVAGFQAGTRLMLMPFKFGANAIGERIRDEMSDIRTAGGLFSISNRMKGGGITPTFEEARAYTEEQNRYLAKLAGSLPGDTQEYIQVSKQISDGIFTLIQNDTANALKLGKQLAIERGATPQEMAKFAGGGKAPLQATGKEMVGEMTKLTVLAGLGGRQGAYGLPQLTERMLSEQKVSMGMFQRYAAIFRDPMIKGALERNIQNINKAGKNTTARYKALQETFKQIVTPELVRAYQRSTAGILEALKTTFLNPETGLLGLGRPLSIMSKKFDDFGNIVRDVSGKIEYETLSIFKYLRDIFGNIVITLQPILDSLAQFFDPFERLGLSLDRLRELTMKFQLSFERYRLAFVNAMPKLTKGLSEEAKQMYMASIPLRASFQAVNNALLALGAYGRDDFDALAAQIADPGKKIKDFGKILLSMIDRFLGSNAAKEVGMAVGEVVGTVISQFGKIVSVAAGLATGGKLAEGFSAGFKAAGGPQGFADIVKSVFHIFGKLLLEVVKAAPLETAMVAALFFLPGAIAGLVSQALSGGLARVLSKAPSLPTIMPGSRAPGTAGPKGGGFIPALDKLKAPNIIAPIKSAFAYIAQEIRAAFALLKMGKFGVVFQGLLTPFKAMGGAIKNLPGLFIKGARGLGKFGGVITAVIAAFDVFGALLSGKDIWESLGAAAGPVVGTIIGFALGGGPIGAAIGSFIGGLKPITDFFTGVFKGIGEAIGPIWDALTIAIDAIIGSFGSLFNIVGGVVGSLFGFTGELDLLNTVLIATKIVLTPFVGLFNGIAAALLLLKLGLIQVDKFINNMFQGGNRAGRLAAAESETYAQLDKIATNQKKWNDNLLKPIDKTQAALNDLSGSASKASVNLTEYQKKTREAITQGKASGLTPSAADMEWYNKAKGKPAANVPAAVPPPAANPVPAIQALDVKQAGANALLAQLKTQVVTSADGVKKQIGASSNAQQAKIQGVTTAIKNLSAKFTGGMPVRVINTPTVKFDMGGIGPVGGGIGGFPKTSGYGMRWGKMHTGNDYAMPVGTKLGIGGPGKVLGAGNWGGYGNAMDIGGPGGMVYRFAHLSKINAPVGAMLPPGYPFALSGNTGRSTGPHLHFEARPGGGGPVPPDAFASIIRANFAGTAIGPLMGAMQNEMKGMPYGAQLAVANSDEIFMKPKQMAGVIEGAARAGAEGTGNITTGPITISIDGYNKDPKELTEVIASQLINAMYRKSRSEVLTS